MHVLRDIYSVYYGLPYFQEFVKVPFGSICQDHVCHLKKKKKANLITRNKTPLKLSGFWLFSQPTSLVGVGKSPFWARFTAWLQVSQGCKCKLCIFREAHRLEILSLQQDFSPQSLTQTMLRSIFGLFGDFSSLPYSLLQILQSVFLTYLCPSVQHPSNDCL